MKIANLAIVGSLSGILLAGTVLAQGVGTSDLRQPMSVQRTVFEYDNYAYFAPEDEPSQSPSDQPEAAEESPVAGTGCGDACEPSCCEASSYEPSFCESCDSGCNGCGDCGGCGGPLGDPWTLPQPDSLASRDIKVAGWMSAGIFSNAYGAASNGPMGFNNVGDGFTMSQLWIYGEKETDTGGYGTDWGFRIDYVFGADGPDTQAFGDRGWDFGWNSSRDYGSAIPQLYFEFAIDDLSIKMGRFFTLIGYEVVPAPDNFFYSSPYTQYYGEPFTHTGFLAEYSMNDRVTFYGGWTAGWDSGWENLNDGSVFLGGVGLSLSDRASLTWAVTAGDFGAGRNGLATGDVYMNSFVFEYLLTDKWTYVFEHDLGANSGLGPGDNEWYGINQYLLYEINDRWGAAMRFEWFRDDDGARVIGGNAGDYYGLTAGVNWKPHANVIFRPEIRYDWYDGIVSAGRPFGNGNNTDQFSGGFDFIVTF